MEKKLSYTIKEFCEATGLGRTYVYARIASGELTRIKAGTRTLVPADSARAFLEHLAAAAGTKS